MVPLAFLEDAEFAEVAQVEGEPAFVSRLQALGLRAGSAVRMVRAGSPCLIEVGSSRLSLRVDDTCSVLVRPLPGAAHDPS